jgi:histidine triad (HIT) family protein
MSDCIFCRIASGEIPASIVYQDDDLIAFRDIRPQAPTHIQIISKLYSI